MAESLKDAVPVAGVPDRRLSSVWEGYARRLSRSTYINIFLRRERVDGDFFLILVSFFSVII